MFDAHNHLQDDRLWNGRDAVLARAAAAGVTGMACCGTAEADWPRVRALAAQQPSIVPALGLHPWQAAGRSPHWLDRLAAQLAAEPRAAVGEIGLDHALDPATFAGQEQVLAAQLALARRLERPAVLHGRRAWGRLVERLEADGPYPAGLLLHAYSGSAELVERLLPLGAWFSFAATVGYSGNRRAHRALQAVPPDRLLLETDAPDMLPPALARGPRETWPPNEPAHLVHTVRAAAERLGLAPDALAAQTAANARRLFRIA